MKLLLVISVLLLIATTFGLNNCNKGGGTDTPTDIAYVEFKELVEHPEAYDGKIIRTEGTYLNAFEASALAASTYEYNGRTFLSDPIIWIEGGNIESKNDCLTIKDEISYPTEFCIARICGLFEYGKQYGHLGQYEYQIDTSFAPAKETRIPTPAWQLPDDKYLHIGHYMFSEGIAIEGDYPQGPFWSTCPPSPPHKPDEMLKMVYTDGWGVSGVVGSGACSRPNYIDEVPFKEEVYSDDKGFEFPEFEIIAINSNGVVYIERLSQTITLEPGQKWRNSVSLIHEFESGKAKLTTTESIVNYGVLDKSEEFEPLWP